MTPLALTRREVLAAFALLRARGLHDFGGAATLVVAFGWDWKLAQEIVHAYLIVKREAAE